MKKLLYELRTILLWRTLHADYGLRIALLSVCCISFVFTSNAATYYVGQSGIPAGNYFTNIQSAVYAAGGGGTVLVSNGTYFISSEIEVTNKMTIRSVKGAEQTVISVNRNYRCFNLVNTNIVISGFTITNGYAYWSSGGGIYCSGTAPLIQRCVIVGNRADDGGGVYGCTISRCVIKNNTAGNGAGCYKSVINNSAIYLNSASKSGGGIGSSVAVNCNITMNDAGDDGGGVSQNSVLTNCIVYYNYAENNSNSYLSSLNYCCTTEETTNGTGNIFVPPDLLTASHIATNSPCVAAGDFSAVTSRDIDDDAWENPPAIGCDQPNPAGISGDISVGINAERIYTYVDIELMFAADVSGALYANNWSFGDGTVAEDTPQVYHSWSSTGEYDVILTCYNATYPAGISATVMVVVTPPVHFAYRNNATPKPPYSTLETAGTNLQQVVDVAGESGMIIVTNGTYTLSSKLIISKKLTFKSAVGPSNTIIDGNGKVKVILGTETIFSGLTVTNGFGYGGGGIAASSLALITNCVVVGNVSEKDGGGIRGGIIVDSVICNNEVQDLSEYGGGIAFAKVKNSEIYGNKSVQHGGGIYNSSVENSIIYNNSAASGAGGVYYSSLNNCVISNNYAGDSGGGGRYSSFRNCMITANLSSNNGGGAFNCEITDSIISKNISVRLGGGVYGGTLTNCLIAGMNSARIGGGVYFYSADDYLINCTVVGNNADQYGGGIVCSNGGTVINSIIYNNQAFIGNDNWMVVFSNITFNFCCTAPTNNLPGGHGCIPDNPMFVVPGLDYTLQDGSPCIDEGYYMSWMDPPATDLAGNPRLYDGQVDIGCYEFIPEPGAFGAAISYLLLIIGIYRKRIPIKISE